MKKIACLVLATLPLSTMAADTWLPVKDVNLMVDQGSILDFSSILPNTAITDYLTVNTAGQITTSLAPTVPKRFLMASLGFGGATGGVPDHATVDLYVTQLKRAGYNMARLDFQDDMLMSGRLTDFDFNPTVVDRIQYLLYALKNAGIYYVLNGLSSENAAYGNIPQRWLNSKNAKLRMYYDTTMQDHWKKMVTLMLATPNPYNNKTPIFADPAFAGLILVNESSLPYLNRVDPATLDPLRPKYLAWLKSKYVTTSALSAAWGTKLLSTESFETSIGFVRNDSGVSARMADQQAFFFSLEKEVTAMMTTHVRAAGFKGLITAYNNWLSPAEQFNRAQLNWVDMHNYFSEPTNFNSPGSVIKQDSLMTSGAQYIAELAVSRQYGKAFTVSEYGQVFWNKFRRESGLAVPAYAAFQDWGVIAQHAYAKTLSYTETGGRKDSIYPYMVGPDPISRASETLAALLYRRGDVAPALRRVGISFDESYSFVNSSSYGAISGDMRRLALVVGVGLDYKGQKQTTQVNGKYIYDATIQPGNNNLWKTGALTTALLSTDLSKTGVYEDDLFNNRVTALRKNSLLATDKQYNTTVGLYRTDTGELTLDVTRRRMTVITPMTEGIAFTTPEQITLGQLRVEAADGPAMVSVSALDGAPLSSSKRMLVIMSSDARNTGMTFSDSAETTLLTPGTGPVTMLARSVTLVLKNTNATALKVYSDTLRGQRGDSIAVTQVTGGISFTLDTSKLSHGPTTYFEIVTQ
ncbi:hypothetical protein GJ699_23875 [Duganella sp. FT80W]|uniref:Glycoside hydrolase family 5 domain-containing protein n=1 Tax=Duganella guangzhouensis TaxID=2666084 RepID=A0A6I2L5T6_9BURK|nr:hypothetical protein [Duganella guangzhouensis]MRW93042.1 hypothetical protein [Duganella guangzhouensis]